MLWEPSIIYVFAASCSSSAVHFSIDIFFCNWLCLIVAMFATQFILDFLFCCTFFSAMLLCLIVTMCLQLSLSWIFFWVFVVHSLRFQSKCVSNFFWSLKESWKWLFRTSLLTVDCMALSGGEWPTGWQEGRDEWPWLSFHSRTQHDFPIPSPLWMKTADVTERQLGIPMQCGITST
jgi:hypothetical protein